MILKFIQFPLLDQSKVVFAHNYYFCCQKPQADEAVVSKIEALKTARNSGDAGLLVTAKADLEKAVEAQHKKEGKLVWPVSKR